MSVAVAVGLVHRRAGVSVMIVERDDPPQRLAEGGVPRPDVSTSQRNLQASMCIDECGPSEIELFTFGCHVQHYPDTSTGNKHAPAPGQVLQPTWRLTPSHTN